MLKLFLLDANYVWVEEIGKTKTQKIMEEVVDVAELSTFFLVAPYAQRALSIL